MPRWCKWQYAQYRTRKGRAELKVRAKLRAQELKKRAYRERKKLDPTFDVEKRNATPIGDLLRAAAMNLNMIDSDTYVYEDRLREDWLFNINQLKDMSVDCLSRYMPLGLAKELHSLLLGD